MQAEPAISSRIYASCDEVISCLQDAETEQAQKGDASELHVIIFDEIDAICKQRGSVSSGSGVHDTVVNQLLTKIDGVDALNNILLIGMTNRCARASCNLTQARCDVHAIWRCVSTAHPRVHWLTAAACKSAFGV